MTTTNNDFTHMDVITILAILKSSDKYYSYDDKLNCAIDMIPFHDAINLDDTEIESKSLYSTHSPHDAMRKIAGLLVCEDIERKDKINMGIELLEFADFNHDKYLCIGSIEKIKELEPVTIARIHSDLIFNYTNMVVGEDDVSQHGGITVVRVSKYKYMLYANDSGNFIKARADIGALTIGEIDDMMKGEECTVSINREEDDWHGDLALAMLKANKINMK